MDDLLIVGAGPAGCSAASWAAQLGLQVRVLERAERPCPVLGSLQFEQSWVLGQPQATLASLGRRYADQALAQAGVAWQLGQAASGLAQRSDGAWQVQVDGGPAVVARALLLATGLRPVRPRAWFTPGAAAQPLDAQTLTQQRERLHPARTLLLGGGDNALENAAWLAQRGHTVTLWSRGPWIAREALAAPVRGDASIHQRFAPMPEKIRFDGACWVVEAAGRPAEHHDHVAVLFGFEPVPEPWTWLSQALGRHVAPGTALPVHGVFVAGDASGRWHPCVQTALADGVQAAQQVLQHLGARPEPATV